MTSDQAKRIRLQAWGSLLLNLGVFGLVSLGIWYSGGGVFDAMFQHPQRQPEPEEVVEKAMLFPPLMALFGYGPPLIKRPWLILYAAAMSFGAGILISSLFRQIDLLKCSMAFLIFLPLGWVTLTYVCHTLLRPSLGDWWQQLYRVQQDEKRQSALSAQKSFLWKMRNANATERKQLHHEYWEFARKKIFQPYVEFVSPPNSNLRNILKRMTNQVTQNFEDCQRELNRVDESFPHSLFAEEILGRTVNLRLPNGQTMILFDSETPLPIAVTKNFQTSSDHQQSGMLHLSWFENGEWAMEEYVVNGIAQQITQKDFFEVTFKIDANKNITCSARKPLTVTRTAEGTR